MTRRRRGLLVGSLLLMGFLSACGLTGLSRSAIFPGCAYPLPAEDELAQGLPGSRVLDYSSDDGVALRGALVRCGKPEAPVAIYFHGNADSAGQNVWLARRLALAGLDVFLAEWRGYGGLDGSPSELGLYRDGAAAIAAVTSAGAGKGGLVLIGRSLGSGVAVELARGRELRALVLVSPFTSMIETARRLVGPLADLAIEDRFASAEKVPEVRAPVVVLHGTEDSLVPFAMGERLVSLAPKGKLVALVGRDHNDLGDWGTTIAQELAELGIPRRR